MSTRKNVSTFTRTIRFPAAWKTHIERHKVSLTEVCQGAVLRELLATCETEKVRQALRDALETAEHNRIRQNGARTAHERRILEDWNKKTR